MSDERVVGTWYRSTLPDGTVWVESTDPDEVVMRSKGRECTFQQSDMIRYSTPYREWAPDASD